MTHAHRLPEEPVHDVLAAEEFALGSADPELHRRHEHTDRERPHDVLAAEEFALGAADPSLHARHEVHDVLAGEAFAVGSADPSLQHAPLVLPDGPHGDGDPHDILAAEEFALPGAPPGSRGPVDDSGWPGRGWLVGAAGLVLVLALRRRRRSA